MVSFLIILCVFVLIAITWWYGAGPFGPLLNRVADGLVPRINPNYITVLGIPLSVLLYNLLLQHAFKSAYVVMWAIWLCDWVDGKIARRFGYTSKFGELLDPLVDCITSYFMYRGFSELGAGSQWMVDLMLMRDIVASSFVRQVSALYGIRTPARQSGKFKAVAKFFGSLIIFPMVWWGEAGALYFAGNVMLVVTIITTFSGLDYLWAAYKAGLFIGWRGDTPETTSK